MLIMICSMVICNYGTEDNVKAASQTESSEEEEILLDDNELSSWEEEEEVWDDDDEIEEDDEDDDEDGQEDDIYVDDTIMVTSEIKEKWENYYNAEVTVTNLTDTVIDDWTVKFKYKDQIEHIWNAEIIEHEEDYYTIKNLEWNQDIKANGSVTFGITAKYKDSIGEISEAYLENSICEVAEEKYSAQYTQYSTWPGYVLGEIKINNISDEKIEDWKIEITANVDIEQIWNAEIESKYVNDNDETTYIIKNKEYNQNIAPGNNSAFGFIAKTTEVNVKVEPVQLFSISSTLQNESEEDDWDSVEEVEGLTEDDFMEYSDYLEYLMLQAEENPGMQKATDNMGIQTFSAKETEAKPQKTVNAKVTSAYKVIGEESGYRKKAFQNFCMGKLKGKNGEKYAYGIVHCGKNAVMLRMSLTTSKKNGKTKREAEIIDRMVLKDFGHSQSLESFVYKGKEYFLLTGKTYKLTADELKKAKQTAKKQNKKLSQVIPYFCTQIACIKYNAGKKTDVKNCGRLVGVTYSNKKRAKFGRLNRVDIGLKDDSRIVIWKRRKSDSAVQVSTFAFDNKIKQKLVEKKKVSFTNKKLLQFKTCFTMKKNTSSYILPQSMQSIDQGGDNTLYISSGREGESPLCIAECSAKKGEFRKKYMLHFGDDFPIQKKKEIEGMHSKGSQLQFVIADIKAVKGKNSDGKKVKIKRQYICVIDK